MIAASSLNELARNWNVPPHVVLYAHNLGYTGLAYGYRLNDPITVGPLGWLKHNDDNSYIVIAPKDKCPPIKLLWLFGYRTEGDDA